MRDVILARCKEAQTAIIGSMLIEEQCVGQVLSAVSEDDFLLGPCKAVYRCIKELFSAGKPIDPLIVSHTLGDAYSQFVCECVEVTPTAANVMQYCEILRADSRVLRLQEIAMQLTSADSIETTKPLVAELNALLIEQSGVKVYSAADLATEFINRMKSEEKPEYIPIGISSLDEKAFIEAGDVVGIGAAPSTGKTAFALQWACTVARKYRVGFYSLETGAAKATDRIFSRAAEVALGDVKKRILPDDAWMRIAQTSVQLSALQLEFIPASGMSAADIMAMSVSRRHQIIFVDYLQLVAGRVKDRSRYETVTENSMTFHLAAQRNGITVVLLSQLARPEKVKGKYLPPDMHSFRESGQIEQDLDLALLMYLVNPDDYRSDRRIKIGKNKEGEKGVVDLTFDGKLQKFSSSKAGAYNAVRKFTAEQKREMREAAEEKAYAQLELPIVEDETPF